MPNEPEVSLPAQWKGLEGEALLCDAIPWHLMQITPKRILLLLGDLKSAVQQLQEAQRMAAYLDGLQSKYAVQYASEVADRLKWQSRALAAEEQLREKDDDADAD